LATDETNETHDLHKSNVLERPKVIYNEKTKKYVMWMHIDDANYNKAIVGVANNESSNFVQTRGHILHDHFRLHKMVTK